MAGITLTLGALSVNITRFSDDTLPRTMPKVGEATVNDGGTLVVNGPVFETKAIWNFTADFTLEQRRLLTAIVTRSHYLRRTTGANYQITLDDETQEYFEPSPQTRAEVPGASIVNVSASDLAFMARWKCWIEEIPTFTATEKANGLLWFGSISAIEGDKVLN